MRSRTQNDPISGEIVSADRPVRLVVIGGSAGAIPPLRDLLGFLPQDLPAVIIAVIHRGLRETHLREILQRRTSMPVVIPADGEELRKGVCYIGRPEAHLLVAPGMQIRTTENGFYQFHNIDALFTSAARHGGDRVIGVVLSGLRKDGTEGLIAVKEAGGLALVQTPDEADYAQMPLDAIQKVAVDFIGPVKGLAAQICRLAGMAKGETFIGQHN